MHYEDAEKLAIFKCISGSHAYGFASLESDMDIRGIFVAPPRYLLGLDSVEQVTHSEGNEDIELHELRKFLHLASNCNPNIIELLFVDDKHILYENKIYNLLRDHNSLFLTKRARHTFSGYAAAQMHRIRNHRGYLLNPPSHQPTRAEFELPEFSRVPKENRRALLSLPDKFVKEEFKDYIRKEQKFEKALKIWKGYQDWNAKRNPQRKELEHKYGYDTKHACHLVRLSNMGKEILRDGTLTVYRPEREELRAIRNGAWSYEKLDAFADAVDGEMAKLEEESKLPYSIDRKKLEKLTVELLTQAYNFDFNKLLYGDK